MQDDLYVLLEKLRDSLNNILEYKNLNSTSNKLENFFYSFEKIRFEIYEKIDFLNETVFDNEIHTINKDYKAKLENDILYLYIPEKLPNLKNKSSYVNKQIILNIANITKPYKRLFYDKFVIVIIKIYDKRKIWDADNRTVKPIQDGLINGEIIKDDNLFNCCYMVQGFYSDLPHIEVFVLEADKILNDINKKLPNIYK